MADCKFVPEGISGEPRKYTVEALQELIESNETVEGTAVRCDEKQNLIVDLGKGITGIIPYGESEVCFEDEIKKISIISKVGKVVCFKVKEIMGKQGNKTMVHLSRKDAQAEYFQFIKKSAHCGDILTARVSNVETFGAFVDIGCGVTALLPSDKISISRVSSAKLALRPGMRLKVVLKSVDNGRITVSHKELLGTWQENVDTFKFKPGETVVGRARAKAEYGIFIELTPNLSGLAELQDGIEENDPVTVYIKNIIPDRMKIKLSILGKAESVSNQDFHYFINEGHIDHWVYTPDGAKRVIETYFDDSEKCIDGYDGIKETDTDTNVSVEVDSE